MCSMCHHCGTESRNTEANYKLEDGDLSKLSGERPILSCKFCGEKREQQSGKLDAWSSYPPPMPSPASSLSTCNSSLSTCSESSVDVDTGGKTVINRLDSSNRRMVADGSNRPIERDVEITEPGVDPKARDSDVEDSRGVSNEEAEVPSVFDDAMWIPPEPENPEDDMECSVAFNDEDDDEECGDGIKWGKPSSLCDSSDEGSSSYKFKEEKQRVIKQLAYGKFKALVSKLLKSVGIAMTEEGVESWVDIVTSLSWEAASYVKPDAIDVNAVGLDGYIKVKCIATGSRTQSQLFKGLVFKKHAAHKRMPTRYKNPKLLLIQGMLGQSTSVLSSFKTMEQEKDYVKPLGEMIDLYNPNVILVEKTVSRDVQEIILQKGMTLVLDMKLHRLERIARYTGAPIYSVSDPPISDTLMSRKLKQCESVYFEKFLEEHSGLGEEGKKQSKTLMFIEGCPARLGCTILLKGSHSDELKRIKSVARCAIVMAHHLMLESSFLLDQKAMFSSVVSDEGLNGLPSDDLQLHLEPSNTTVSNIEDSSLRISDTVDIPSSNGSNVQHISHPESCSLDGTCMEGSTTDMSCALDIPISNGFNEDGHISSNPGSEGSSPGSNVGQTFLSDFSSYEALSSMFGINGRFGQADAVSEASEAVNQCDMEAMKVCNGNNSHDIERPSSLAECTGGDDKLEDNLEADHKQVQRKDGINTVLDSESILVLTSSRNATKGTVCNQSRFSHIMFYRNFDVPLGKYLRDNLLNQGSQCPACYEPPESHFYYYAHHNRQLTIQVKRLPSEIHLPGEAEGKLWMWSCCGKCRPQGGPKESTKRVLISSASRGLSFGKFLELSFSQRTLASRRSNCGHSLRKDFLYFFGLGSLVAMFRYSPVRTYTVCVPPHKLEFSHSIHKDCLIKETENVYTNGILLFMEVEDSLKKMRPQLSGSTLDLGGTVKSFSEIEEMLKQERDEFETSIQNIVKESWNPTQAVYKLLSLNRLLWELLLESCIWERRLLALLSPDRRVVNAGVTVKSMQDQDEPKIDGTAEKIKQTQTIMENGDKGFSDQTDLKLKSTISVEASSMPAEEIPVETFSLESEEQATRDSGPLLSDDNCQSRLFEPENAEESAVACNGHFGSVECHVEHSPANEEITDRPIDISSDHEDSDESANENVMKKISSQHSLPCSQETSRQWFWRPFAEIRQMDIKQIQRELSLLPKSESVSSYTLEHLPKLYQMISEEGSRVHIPVGTGNYIVSDYEGEHSSVIACALAFLNDIPVTTEVLDEDRRDRETGMPNSTRTLSQLSSTSFDSDVTGVSSEEIRFSSFDGLNLLDSLGHPEFRHPEVSLGNVKLPGKGKKYSVICLYANQFREIRNRCFPSELDFIASLSRCKNWDAKGGKSKSVFAKTLDDRFIIKEIKKTEFESFMKFAQDYFKYMNQCYESGNQTCLAKVLGIYQVVIRQTRSGKEMRHDLMVMENLSFGRSIDRQYDLKGALHARYNMAANVSGEVLLDQNFVNDMNSSPLYVSQKAKRILERAIWNDTTFLNSINVMDYSLLVGVDTRRQELVCGIIDYLRQYTWDKQLETWVKSSFSVPKNVLPTVISPKEYKKRFRKFMSTYFLSVPDHWCSKRSADPCELCGVKDKVAFKSKSEKNGGLNGLPT